MELLDLMTDSVSLTTGKIDQKALEQLILQKHGRVLPKLKIKWIPLQMKRSDDLIH